MWVDAEPMTVRSGLLTVATAIRAPICFSTGIMWQARADRRNYPWLH